MRGCEPNCAGRGRVKVESLQNVLESSIGDGMAAASLSARTTRPRPQPCVALGVSAHVVCRRCQMRAVGDTGASGGSADGASASGHGSATASLAAGRSVDVKAAGVAIATIGIIAAVASEAGPGGWGAALPSRAAIPAALGYDMTRYSPAAL